MPDNTEADGNECLEIVKSINEANKAKEGHVLEEIEERIIKNTVLYSKA